MKKSTKGILIFSGITLLTGSAIYFGLKAKAKRDAEKVQQNAILVKPKV